MLAGRPEPVAYLQPADRLEPAQPVDAEPAQRLDEVGIDATVRHQRLDCERREELAHRRCRHRHRAPGPGAARGGERGKPSGRGADAGARSGTLQPQQHRRPPAVELLDRARREQRPPGARRLERQPEVFEARGKDHYLRIGVGRERMRLVVSKGSIAIEGISLTVAEVMEAAFAVWIIPHTLAVTNLGEKRRGDPVNLEFDLLGKHVEKLLAARTT